MCLTQGHDSDTGEAQTRDPSISSKYNSREMQSVTHNFLQLLPFKNDYSTEYLYHLWLVSKTVTKTFQRNSVICCATVLGIMNINCRFSLTVRKSTLYNSREQNIYILLLNCTCTGHIPLLMHGYSPLIYSGDF